MIWIIIAVVYALIVIGFLVAMYTEAPKQGSRVGVVHYLVALLWPFWSIWFSWIVADDWWNERKKKKRGNRV